MEIWTWLREILILIILKTQPNLTAESRRCKRKNVVGFGNSNDVSLQKAL